MNKKLAGLLVLCVLAAGAAGFMLGKVSPDFSKKREPRSAAEVGVEPTAEVGEDEASPEPVLVPEPDYEKLWATHEAQEVVATVNGREQRWEDYFYFLHAQAEQIYNYFDSMGNYYGMALDWDDVAEGDDMTYAQIAVRSTEDALRQFAAIEGFAEENKVKLSADKLKEIEEQTDADLRAYLGEEASDEEVEAYRQEIYLPYSVNLRLNRANVLYQEGFKKLYGEDGKKYSDKDTLAFLEEEGYISANHILLMTMDQTTGEALDEEAVAEIEAKAKALAEELQGIKKTDALLRRFKELKEELCEDTGKVSYPDGYTFTPGTMVSEFEDACNSLEDYQVSDPVKSSYGYHIILRLPLDPEALLSGGAAEPLTARATAANMAYGQRLQEYMDGLELVYAPGVEAPDLVKYLIFPTVEETETVPESESEG